MTLTQEQIEKLSKILSKIELNDKKFFKDIKDILNYVDLLWEVDTTWVKETNSVVEKDNILRKDEELREIEREELLKCSPQKIIQNQIVISNIL